MNPAAVPSSLMAKAIGWPGQTWLRYVVVARPGVMSGIAYAITSRSTPSPAGTASSMRASAISA